MHASKKQDLHMKRKINACRYIIDFMGTLKKQEERYTTQGHRPENSSPNYARGK